MRTPPGFAPVVVVVVALLWAGVVVAQWQVNNRVNNRVRTEKYGNNGGTIRYGGTNNYLTSPAPVGMANYGGTRNYKDGTANPMLPSEVRNMYWQSGALPSDIRYSQARLGPLVPGGAASYIPVKQETPRQYTAGNYVDTRISPQNTAYLKAASSSKGGGGDTVRYGGLPSGQVRTGAMVVTPGAKPTGGGGGGGGGTGQVAAGTFAPSDGSGNSGILYLPKAVSAPPSGSIRYSELSEGLFNDGTKPGSTTRQ
jgi:hypothetical protein